MKLSSGEKLILVMLSEIYKALKIKGEIDPEVVMRSIFNDQTWGLRWEYGSLFNEPDAENPAVVDETCAILDMYRYVTPAFDKLPKAEQERVKKDAYPFSDFITFQGFDGNHDPHFSVVGYLVNTLDKYHELKGAKASLNSHSSGTLPHYRDMLKIYEEEMETTSLGSIPLTADQLIKILKGGR